MRGLIDRKGELFGYLKGKTIFTLDGEATGRIEGNFIIDMAGNKIWHIVGDAVYTLVEHEPVGYFGSETAEDF